MLKSGLTISVALLFSILLFSSAQAQKLSKEEKKARKDSIKADKIAKGKLMVTPLAGPGYTPELGGLIAATAMITFKTNKKDSLIQRSSFPPAVGVTTTGAYFFSSILTSFWLQDKLRINADINFKNMPDNYWGVGYEAGRHTPKGDSTTGYTRLWWWFNPRFLWQFKKNNFLGLNLDLNYTKANDVSPGMDSDKYYQMFGAENYNSGVGIIYQYDSRDIPVNAWRGFYANISATFYGGFLGGKNNYQVYQIDTRKYFNLFARKGSTLATQIEFRGSGGNVPWAELSQPGTPFDLRGYTWGQYRDKDMLFAIAEYRYMFMKKNQTLSKSGVVGWVGAGTLGETVGTFTGILPDVGFGYRFEVQPRMNLRIDFGWGIQTFGFYFNFNEAF